MQPLVPIWFVVLGLGLAGLLLLAAIAVVVALLRSGAGRWLLAAGAMFLTILVGLLVPFLWVSGTPQIETRVADESSDTRAMMHSESRLAQIPLHATSGSAGAAESDAESSASPSSEAPNRIAAEGSNSAKQSAVAARQLKRPAWLDLPPGRDEKGYHAIVASGPYATVSECNQNLPETLQAAVRDYAERLLGADAGERVQLDLPFIHKNIVRDEWLEQTEFTFGTMYNLHERLEFDAAATREIERQYRGSQVRSRLARTGAGALLALGLVGVLFGYLKLDTLTRGYYSGRLRLAAGAVILAEAVLAGLLVRGNIGF